MQDLYELAFRFRQAIESAIACREVSDLNMLNYPRGCCTYASTLLQRYLFENGVMTFYMSGEYGDGVEIFESHAWLETECGIVIDITGDQYTNNPNIRFSNSVYIGSRENGFHNKFRLHAPIPYSEWGEYGIGMKNKILYEAIIRHIN